MDPTVRQYADSDMTMEMYSSWPLFDDYENKENPDDLYSKYECEIRTYILQTVTQGIADIVHGRIHEGLLA